MPEPTAIDDAPRSPPDVLDAVTAPPRMRPVLRGTLHRWAVPVAVTLTALLTLRASGAGDRAAVLVYGLGMTAMLATSGLYHHARLAHSERRFLRRLDHSMILVSIAGTYTAVIVLALDGAERVVLLSVAWVLAIVGVLLRMRWMHAPPVLVGAVYLVAGWQILLDFPAYEAALTAGELALLAVGGVLYTVGALVFATKRPNPWPAVFGYHEVFHTLVVAAAIVQWVAVWLLAA